MRHRHCSTGRRFTAWVRLTLVAAGLAGAAALSVADEPGSDLLRTDSQAPYVHRITLYDHSGKAIDPRATPALPYSPMMTCGKCHAVGQIAHGWHFNAGITTVPAGRPGEPWFYHDAAAGTLLPLTERYWPGAWRPSDVGLESWDLVKRFGRHQPGGGVGTPTSAEQEAARVFPRWNVSGTYEVDCMVCHSVDQQHDPAELARQVERENFKWAPTAALGLAVVRGEARRAPDEWDPFTPPHPDYPDQAGPILIYDRTRFDPDDRVFFNVTRRVPNERCTFCHTLRPVAVPPAPPIERWHTENDVHLAAGLSCVDCHRHGLDHATTRGYPGEVDPRSDPTRATLSCRGCHYGDSGAAEVRNAAVAGRAGAPRPAHAGLPPLHLEKLSCTACHSGPWPQLQAQRVQTALAHGLGLPERGRSGSAVPQIQEPVFATREGLITPHRLVWPAFWGYAGGDDVVPIPVDRVERTVRRLPRDLVPGSDEFRVQLATRLQADAPDGARVVYVDGGYVHDPTDAGVVPYEHAAAEPYLWPLAHQVRPAAQALGSGGCTDCHARDGAMFFGHVAVPALQATTDLPPRTMADFTLYDPRLAEVWALSFKARPIFKLYGWLAAAVVGLLLLRASQEWLGQRVLRIGTLPAATLDSAQWGSVRMVLGVLLVAIVLQAVNAFGALNLRGELAGWALLVHMGGAGLFIAALVGFAWLGARHHVSGRARSRLHGGLFWLVLLLGTGVLGTMLMAMQGHMSMDRQHEWIEWHERGAIGLVLAVALYLLAGRWARPQRVKAAQ